MRQISKQEMDNILRAVVSIYINLLKISGTGSHEINLVYNILNSIFGKEIALQNIKKIITNQYSMRQATNVLKKYLNYSDRIKLLLNLMSFMYIHNKDFKVLGSLEIVKMVDLLYLDINFYEQILDVIFFKDNKIDISLQHLIQERDDCIFKNHFIIGSEDTGNVFFRIDGKDDILVCLMFEGLTFIGTPYKNLVSLNGEVLEENKAYFLKQTDSVSILDGEKEFSISYHQLLFLYQQYLNDIKKTIHYQKNKINLDLIQNATKIQLKINSGKILFNKELTNHNQYIALNDEIEIEEKHTGIDILLNRVSLYKKAIGKDVFYIENANNFYRINHQKTSDSIIKFQRKGVDYEIETFKTNIDIFVNNQLVEQSKIFRLNKDLISIADKTFKINKFFDLVKVEHDISELVVNDVYHEFDDGKTIALNEINFKVKKGEILSIMGPSGSGKTTLLKTLMGEYHPKRANIEIDGYDFYKNYHFFQKFIAYVPQDDLLYSNLTVYENLYFSAKLRLTHIKNNDEINRRIDNILKQIGLFDKKDMIVGDAYNKTLSGGQRKRLNIALELLSDPLIIFLDEPTSGLSSKDSEKLLEMLTELKHQGKMIIATIHQPNPDIFQQFDKFLFLDIQGTQVYFGGVNEAFDYFDDEYKQLVLEDEQLKIKKELKMPEFLFDILEYPQSSNQAESMAIVDHLTNEEFSNRRFSPNYWKNKFNRFKLVELMQMETAKNDKTIEDTSQKLKTKKLTIRENISQFYNLFLRNLKNKSKNRINLLMTFLGAPILSFLIAGILRFTNEGEAYSLWGNKNILMFSFISVIIFIFLGMVNSLDEILPEKLMILREKKLNIKTSFFLISKIITLEIFTLIQVLLYVAVALLVLKIKGLELIYIIFLLLSGMIGFSIGLFFSTYLKDRKFIMTLLPVVFIPQIMFAGAVIKFEEMNPHMIILKSRTIPEFCELIPSKWLFEGLVVSQFKYNKYDRMHRKFHQMKMDAKGNPRLKAMINREINNFIKEYPKEEYKNEMIERGVFTQDGKYTNRNKNFFMASVIKINGVEYEKIFFNSVVILFMLFMLNLTIYIKLKFFYE